MAIQEAPVEAFVAGRYTRLGRDPDRPGQLWYWDADAKKWVRLK